MSKRIPAPKVWPDAAEESASRRLWAALVLSPRLEVCEALLAGVAVPTHRLDPGWVRALGLDGDVALDEALVLRVNGYGPR